MNSGVPEGSVDPATLAVIVKQIFHHGQPSHCGDRNIFKVMTSTLPKGTLVSSILYQGNADRSHTLWIIVASAKYTLHMQVLLECCYT